MLKSFMSRGNLQAELPLELQDIPHFICENNTVSMADGQVKLKINATSVQILNTDGSIWCPGSSGQGSNSGVGTGSTIHIISTHECGVIYCPGSFLYGYINVYSSSGVKKVNIFNINHRDYTQIKSLLTHTADSVSGSLGLIANAPGGITMFMESNLKAYHTDINYPPSGNFAAMPYTNRAIYATNAEQTRGSVLTVTNATGQTNTFIKLDTQHAIKLD